MRAEEGIRELVGSVGVGDVFWVRVCVCVCVCVCVLLYICVSARDSLCWVFGVRRLVKLTLWLYLVLWHLINVDNQLL